jgi:hypothetical protein
VVTLTLRCSGAGPTGVVEVHNDGDAALRIWRTGTSWGDTALRFEATTGSGVVRIARKALIYTRDVPSTVEIGPGEGLDLPFDLADGTWQVEPSGDDVPDLTGARLEAVYEIAPSAEAREQGTWTGTARSVTG